ncbi:hypothetical protein ABZ769_36425 [Streptomyces olivoreticuli]
MLQARADFIAPANTYLVPAAVLCTLDLARAEPSAYVSQRDQGKPAQEASCYHVIEDTMLLPGKRKCDLVLALRRLFVHSAARARGTATARDRKVNRAREKLERLVHGLGTNYLPDLTAVTARVYRALSQWSSIG